MSQDQDEFFATVQQSLLDGSLITLTLSNRVRDAGNQPRRQTLRPVMIRNALCFQWELQFEKQQTHLNLEAPETMQRVRNLLGTTYRDASLFTTREDVIARGTAQGIRLRRLPPSRQLPSSTPAHDKKKEYLIPEGVPCPFLIELDVMTASGQVKQQRQKKFRQINRYLEIVNDVYDHLPASGLLRVVDFGCGLSYLTFALQYLLSTIHQREVELLGIDQNEHVIGRCRAIAEKLSLPGMEFRSQQIASGMPTATADLAVSLHACDTATDHALAFAVAAEARVILAAPCCQHELARKIRVPALQVLLQYGVMKDRFAAMATDVLRGSALEAVGYRTQILEFIDLEHTPKNLLLRAVKRPAQEGVPPNDAEYTELKRTLGVETLSTDAIFQALAAKS